MPGPILCQALPLVRPSRILGNEFNEEVTLSALGEITSYGLDLNVAEVLLPHATNGGLRNQLRVALLIDLNSTD